MQAMPEGVEVLLSAIEELKAEMPPAKRTLTLKPSAEPGALKSIKLIYSPMTDELSIMSINADKGAAILYFTEAGIKDIVTAFNHWRDGSEDFCLFPRGKKSELKAKDIESWEIWFWVNMMP
jgi:hypothetical protein